MRGGAKLAYVCHVFPYLTQTFVYREVEELRRDGIPLTVFSMKPVDFNLISAESRHLVEQTIYFPPVTSPGVLASQAYWLFRSPRRYRRALALVARSRYRFNNTPWLWLHGLVDFARGAHLARLLLRDRDCCHLHAQFADDACTTTLIASMLTGIRFSFRSHTSPNPQMIQEKVRQAQFVASASRYDQRVLVHWCGEPAASKIHVNHLGVPLDRYDPDAGVQDPSDRASDHLNARTPERLILSVGTLIPEKGFEYVIRACRLLSDQGIAYGCLIVGDGPDRAKLEALVAMLGLGDRVTLASYRPQEELRDLFRQATVFALPCIFPLNGNVDVIPLVLQEAMAMGRPVVSTPISGIPELIRHEVNGLLVPEKDHEALAAALARLLADRDLALRLGMAARRTVIEQFDVAVNAAALADLLLAEVPELAHHAHRLEATDPSPFSELPGEPEPRDFPDQPGEEPITAAPSASPPPVAEDGCRGVRARSLRVAWVAEIPVPYRAGLYRRLRREAGIDLKLFFCSLTQADRRWTVSMDGLPHVVLPGITAAVRAREQFFLRINPGVWRALSAFQPDVVVVGGYAHVTMQLAMLWCRRTGIPYVINSESHRGCRPAVAGRRPHGAQARRPFVFPAATGWSLTAAVKRFFIRGAAAGLPAGTLARDYLVAHGGPADRMFFLPNACPVDAFGREAERVRREHRSLRHELGLRPGPVLLYVGRLTPVKGLDTLLRAFAQVRRSGVQDRSDPTDPERLNTRMPEPLNDLPTLLLVGEGEQRGELEALAGELGVAERVCFAGARPWEELPAIYAGADLLVLPSTFEPWGAVVHEAMACGLPVVVSDRVGCAPDLVRPGENGWVVRAGDAGALAEVLQAALAEPARRAKMGAASTRRAGEWGEDACLAAFRAAMHAAAAGRPVPGPALARSESPEAPA